MPAGDPPGGDEEQTTSGADLDDILETVAGDVHPQMSEGDVEDAFIDHGFFDALGFEQHGGDIQKERRLEDGTRPDITTLRDSSAAVAVYEFKSPTESLNDHVSQLEGYVTALKAEYGVLTNGRTIRLYEREDEGMERFVEFGLGDASGVDYMDTVEDALRKGEWSLGSTAHVEEYREWIATNQLGLESEIAQTFFFDTFRFDRQGSFGELVEATMALLSELRDEQDQSFVRGAFEFWRQSYADIPSKKNVPKAWYPYVVPDGENEIQDNINQDRLADFMFSLETGFALLSRLFLAKACDDYGFFENDPLRGRLDSLGDRSDSIDPAEYPSLVDAVFGQLRDELIESLFEDDLFVWWTDGYRDTIAESEHAARFGDLSGATDVDTSVEAVRDSFSKTLGELFFAVLKFDFSEVNNVDLLGGLYQRYFDADTRKALGEFYTPSELVDLILDRVGYQQGVGRKRLIDPSCGSGTFLTEALQRHLDDIEQRSDDPDWAEELRALCLEPRIVGIDIHPFAVLMAQISFTLTILPHYRTAKRTDPEFTLRRLPIFRADTLEKEVSGPGADIGGQGQQTFNTIQEDSRDVRVPIDLPLTTDSEAGEDGDEFLTRELTLPTYDALQERGGPTVGVVDYGDYFRVLQAMLDVTRAHVDAPTSGGTITEYDANIASLDRALEQYLDHAPGSLSPFLESYVEEILELVAELQSNHGDGRLFKMFEDVTLGVVVKNYLEYDYVVANPPYVESGKIPAEDKDTYEQIYPETYPDRKTDLYCPFYQRGIDWLKPDGTLGYITPNQFMVSRYGRGVRSYLAQQTELQDLFDFRDAGVFQDATNYPAIVVASKLSEGGGAPENEINCVRVKGRDEEDTEVAAGQDSNEDGLDIDQWVDTRHQTEEEGTSLDMDLDTAVVSEIRDHCEDSGRYTHIDTFQFTQGDLREEFWAPMPTDEWALFQHLEDQRDTRLSGLIDLHAGTQTGMNDVYLVVPTEEYRIDADETGGTVEVVPKGLDETVEIDRGLLRPWLQGEDVTRWRSDWSGEHVIFPYERIQGDGGITYDAIDPETMREEHGATMDYFERFEEDLKGREGGKMEGEECWYEFTAPKSHKEHSEPKLICAETAAETRFMIDEDGTWLFKSAYGAPYPPEYADRRAYLSAFLNSSIFDYYLKHVTSLKSGGYYKYTTQYVGRVPIITDPDAHSGRIEELVEQILELRDIELRTQRFPEAYLDAVDGEQRLLTHQWEESHKPVSEASYDEDLEGPIVVAEDEQIVDDWIRDSETNAEYVAAAVMNRSVQAGEITRIVYPDSDATVDEMLNAWQIDRQRVADIDSRIEELETELNELIYSLFELDEEEEYRETLERFVEEF